METIHVVNIKCGGCQEKIRSTLEKEGLTNISVNVEDQTVSFDGNSEIARKKLSQMGYPEANSKEARSLLKKGKSYLSCAIGRMK